MSSGPLEIPEVSIADFLADSDPNKLVLDVREPMETMYGVIAGARCIPLGELEARIDEVPDDGNIYVVCRSGGRSAYATEVLLHMGKMGVKNLSGGMIAWSHAGETTEKPR
jgi:rhodanese-related sulfurtransferase